MANTPRYFCFDAAAAQPAHHGLKPVGDLTAGFTQKQAVGGHHLDTPGRQDPRRRMHDRTQYAFPRKRTLLRLIRVDRLKRLIRQCTAEIMEEPPWDAVGAADDHGVGTDERTQGRREIRQDLRLHGEEHIVMNAEVGRRSGARPALPRLTSPLDDEAAGTQRRQGRPARQHRHGPSGAVESVADPGADGARPHDGGRWTQPSGLWDSAIRYQSSFRVPIMMVASRKNIASAPNTKA